VTSFYCVPAHQADDWPRHAAACRAEAARRDGCALARREEDVVAELSV